jgi:DNA-binding LacI/PurR family transcriptional regulator
MESSDRNVERAGPHRPPSIKDIARMANVSHSTVSRALVSSALVRPQTADRIRRIAREAGYQPSAAARSLVTRKSFTIGIVVTTIADPFVAEVVSGIEDVAKNHGYSVFLSNSNADPERERQMVQTFAERRVDGIVVTSSRVGAMYMPLLSQMMVPVVLINNQHPGAFIHSVMVENVDASRAATRHLVSLGHRRIAYLGDRYGYQSDTERFMGYRQALELAALPFQPELVVHGDGGSEGGEQAMSSLLALTQRPSAVFCYNDMSALGALRTIRVAGLRVPDDISVVGFDDLYVARYTNPPLTTVRQPMRRMGLLAMESLLKLMAGQNSLETLVVPAEFIMRESTAAPPGHVSAHLE